MPPKEILAKLLAGRVVLHPVTIPEGYTLAQIADVLEAQNVTDAKEFTKLVRDRPFITTLGIEADSLEGYLFPETYSFARGTKAKDVIKTMVDGLNRVWGSDLQAQAARMNLSLHQVLTLASVIEKETGAKDERELIAAVFHNRLRKKIPLQSDPTVIYACRRSTGTFINAISPASVPTIRTVCKASRRDRSAAPAPIRFTLRCFPPRRPTFTSCRVTTGPITFPPPWPNIIKPWRSIKAAVSKTCEGQSRGPRRLIA